MVAGLGGALTRYPIAPDRLAGLPVDARFTAAMWHRILLPELLPGLERVLYLDVDTLAVGALGAAVGDRPARRAGRRRRQRLPARPPSLAANARAAGGARVLQLRRAAARPRRPARRGRGGAAARGRRGADRRGLARPGRAQPRARARGATRCTRASTPRTPCGPSGERRRAHGLRAPRAARAAPVIRHFEGPGANKPWHPGCIQPLHERYAEHRRGTPWPLTALIARRPV
jgi:hypothetical protein